MPAGKPLAQHKAEPLPVAMPERSAHLAAREQEEDGDRRRHLVHEDHIVLPLAPACSMHLCNDPAATALLHVSIKPKPKTQPQEYLHEVTTTAAAAHGRAAPEGCPGDVHGDEDAAHVGAEGMRAIGESPREPGASDGDREGTVQRLLEAPVAVVVRGVHVHLAPESAACS